MNYYDNDKPQNDENSVIKLTNSSGTYLHIPFRIDTGSIVNLHKPIATGNFKTNFPLTSLNNLFEKNTVVFRRETAAKTFIRPEWTKLLTAIRNQKNKMDLILFTKWDRFSRNAPDAYQMIAILKKLGVEPQAIEQPLDMEVPENKMMLAIYLTAPEIKNDRRALNVFYGMRRARKEGRYMATAPIGYKNRTLDGGRKTIVPHEPAASVLQWAFDELSIGQNTVVEIYRQAKAKGLPCSKNNFWHALRNPVYIGKIVIPQLKEESYMVDGLHEPLIKPSVFYGVQDVLEGRKRNLKTRL